MFDINKFHFLYNLKRLLYISSGNFFLKLGRFSHMLKTNLIQILSKFDLNTFKKFGKFLNSPYFNNNEKLLGLYEILKEHYPHFDSPVISKENIFRKLYKKDRVVMGTMYYLISEMEKQLETFVSIEKMNPVNFDFALLEELTNLGMNNLFDKKYKEFKKKMKIMPDTYNLNRFLLTSINRNNKRSKREFLTKKDIYGKEWFEPLDELVKLFLKNILTNIQTLANFKRTCNEDIDIPLLDETLKYLESNDKYKADIEIELIYYQIKLLLGFEENYYHKIKKIMKEDSDKISPYQFEESKITLQNYFTDRILKGNDLREEQFDLIKLQLSKFDNTKQKRLRIDTFYQAFMLAISLEKYDWAKEFIDKYGKHLDEKFQNNAISYGNARIFYQEKDYDKALRELAKIKNYSFIHYKPPVKILQLMLFYDLKLLSQAEDAANSFLKFLNNDKLITLKIKKSYINFLKIYVKLIKTEGTYNESRISSLMLSVNKQKGFLVSRNWFIKKIKELESKAYKRIKAI